MKVRASIRSLAKKEGAIVVRRRGKLRRYKKDHCRANTKA